MSKNEDPNTQGKTLPLHEGKKKNLINETSQNENCEMKSSKDVELKNLERIMIIEKEKFDQLKVDISSNKRLEELEEDKIQEKEIFNEYEIPDHVPDPNYDFSSSIDDKIKNLYENLINKNKNSQKICKIGNEQTVEEVNKQEKKEVKSKTKKPPKNDVKEGESIFEIYGDCSLKSKKKIHFGRKSVTIDDGGTTRVVRYKKIEFDFKSPLEHTKGDLVLKEFSYTIPPEDPHFVGVEKSQYVALKKKFRKEKGKKKIQELEEKHKKEMERTKKDFEENYQKKMKNKIKELEEKHKKDFEVENSDLIKKLEKVKSKKQYLERSLKEERENFKIHEKFKKENEERLLVLEKNLKIKDMELYKMCMECEEKTKMNKKMEEMEKKYLKDNKKEIDDYRTKTAQIQNNYNILFLKHKKYRQEKKEEKKKYQQNIKKLKSQIKKKKSMTIKNDTARLKEAFSLCLNKCEGLSNLNDEMKMNEERNLRKIGDLVQLNNKLNEEFNEKLAKSNDKLTKLGKKFDTEKIKLKEEKEKEINKLNEEINEKLTKSKKKVENLEKKINSFFLNQIDLRFTTFKDYKIISKIGGKTVRNPNQWGLNSFIYKIEFNENVYAMKILKIPRSYGEKFSKFISQKSVEIYGIIGNELNFPPHPNVIPIFHAFKEELDDDKIKVLDPGDQKEFEPNYLPVLCRNTGILIMKYFEMNLQELVEHRNHKFSEKEFLSILSQLLNGIDHIFENKIVHRDIKGDIFVEVVHFVGLCLVGKESFDYQKIEVKNIITFFKVHCDAKVISIEIQESRNVLLVQCKSEIDKNKIQKLKTIILFGSKFKVNQVENQFRCVIGDFGCSILCQNGFNNQDSSKISGNPYHYPKEIFTAIGLGKKLDYSKSDLFAIGVTAYQMISKEDPFGGISSDKREQKHYKDIQNNFSPHTKDLIRRMCMVDKKSRCSIKEGLKILNIILSKK